MSYNHRHAPTCPTRMPLLHYSGILTKSDPEDEQLKWVRRSRVVRRWCRQRSWDPDAKITKYFLRIKFGKIISIFSRSWKLGKCFWNSSSFIIKRFYIIWNLFLLIYICLHIFTFTITFLEKKRYQFNSVLLKQFIKGRKNGNSVVTMQWWERRGQIIALPWSPLLFRTSFAQLWFFILIKAFIALFLVVFVILRMATINCRSQFVNSTQRWILSWIF